MAYSPASNYLARVTDTINNSLVMYGRLISVQPRRQGTLKTIFDPHSGKVVTYTGDIANGTAAPVKGFTAYDYRARNDIISDEKRVSGGQMHLLSTNYMDLRAIDTRSRWQYFRDWLKWKFKK